MKNYLAELHNPYYMEQPIKSVLKALGLDLFSILPTAFYVYGLEFFPRGNSRNMHPGFYFIVRYRHSRKLYGYIITTAEELDRDYIKAVIDEIVAKARKDKLRRVILLP